MKYLAIILALAAVVLPFARAADYCNPKLCLPGKTHVACGNNGKFATACPPNARLVDMAPHISTILDYHNNKRNLIANGSVSPFLAATRMATMEWNKKLAKLAVFNVKQCQMAHDSCHNTVNFKYSGQNLAIGHYNGDESSFSDSFLLEILMENWWNEHNSTTLAQIESYPEKPAENFIGHFTAMIGERQKYIGCAISRWLNLTSGKNDILLACNLASANLIEWETYTTGKVASACKSGANPKYPNLCSTAETGYLL